MTTPPAPWSRAHSANRALTLVPREGFVRAMPAEIHTGRAATRTNKIALKTLCRRTQRPVRMTLGAGLAILGLSEVADEINCGNPEFAPG